jgi:hypothetical protein
MASLPPEGAAAWAGEIGGSARLWRAHGELDGSPLWPIPFRSDAALVGRVPGLEYLFLYHCDGRVREAALRAIAGPLPAPFHVAAVAYRLNDWAWQVREAAAACIGRTLPASAARAIAPAALFLLDRGRHWQRWQAERGVLDAALGREDVVEGVAAEIAARAHGPMARALAAALRWPAMDRHLAGLARRARQPAVRATAFAALFSGRARWPVRMCLRWIDKSLGRSEWVADYAERPLAPSGEAVSIEEAARDPAIAVRKVAAQALIDRGIGDAQALRLLQDLATDPSRAVRERAAFALERQASAGG